MQQHVSDHRLQGATFSMSGKKTDADVNMLSSDIVKPINDELFFDSSFLPAFEYPLVDHRERPVRLLLRNIEFTNICTDLSKRVCGRLLSSWIVESAHQG
jgi:hypothetical protein